MLRWLVHLSRPQTRSWTYLHRVPEPPIQLYKPSLYLFGTCCSAQRRFCNFNNTLGCTGKSHQGRCTLTPIRKDAISRLMSSRREGPQNRGQVETLLEVVRNRKRGSSMPENLVEKACRRGAKPRMATAPGEGRLPHPGKRGDAASTWPT